MIEDRDSEAKSSNSGVEVHFRVGEVLPCNIVEQKTSRIKAILTAEENRGIDLLQGSKLFFYTTCTKVCSVLKITCGSTVDIYD